MPSLSPKEFLLSYVGFDEHSQAFIDTEVDGAISRHPIMGRHFAIEFDISTRYCTGWVDFDNRRHQVCPDRSLVDDKYSQCIKCRNLTGFNPAFYHATSVSKQQEAINQKPHFVYLAYFCPGLIKVGISQQSRGIRRLLEQGARSALVLETFPSALIARQYEEKIAMLDQVTEHVTYSKKMACITSPLDEQSATEELQGLKEQIESALGLTFENSRVVSTSQHFGSSAIAVEKLTIMKDQPLLIGDCVSVIGSTLILQHQDRLLAYNLKSLLGYRATPASSDATLSLPSEQMTLF